MNPTTNQPDHNPTNSRRAKIGRVRIRVQPENLLARKCLVRRSGRDLRQCKREPFLGTRLPQFDTVEVAICANIRGCFPFDLWWGGGVWAEFGGCL